MPNRFPTEAANADSMQGDAPGGAATRKAPLSPGSDEATGEPGKDALPPPREADVDQVSCP